MELLQLVAEFRETYKSMLLSKKQTAAELNIRPHTLDRLRQDGVISSKKIGGQIMFRIDEVARYILSA